MIGRAAGNGAGAHGSAAKGAAGGVSRGAAGGVSRGAAEGTGGSAADIARREARIMARVTEDARVKGRTAGEALATIADLVRYTFEYPADAYTEGMRGDVERLWREGYIQLAARDYWASDTWKGVSSSWQEPAPGSCSRSSSTRRRPSRPGTVRTPPTSGYATRPRPMASGRRSWRHCVRSTRAPPRRTPRPPRRTARSSDWPSRRRQNAPGPGTSVPGMPTRLPSALPTYAIVDRYSSEDRPAGVLRRIEHADADGGTGQHQPGQHQPGQRDEAFGRDLRWRHTFLLYSWERGNLDNSLHEISADRARRITDQIRREVTR